MLSCEFKSFDDQNFNYLGTRVIDLLKRFRDLAYLRDRSKFESEFTKMIDDFPTTTGKLEDHLVEYHQRKALWSETEEGTRLGQHTTGLTNVISPA